MHSVITKKHKEQDFLLVVLYKHTVERKNYMIKELKHLLPALIKKDDTWQVVLLSKWNTIIGNLQGKMRLESINNDTLVVGVFDACWMQELYLLSPLLINTINQSLDQPRIKHLRFKRAVAKKTYKPAPLKTPCNPAPLVLTTKQHKALAAIEDPQLRLALHNFLIRCNKEIV